MGWFSNIAGMINPGKMYGETPKLPRVPTTEEVGKDFAAGNLANVEQFKQLGGEVNEYQMEWLKKYLAMQDERLASKVPGLNDINEGASKLLQQMIGGQVPDDVSAAVRRSAAGKALAGGFGGSGMGRSLEARDLGLTSLQLSQQGLDSAGRWISNVVQTQASMNLPFQIADITRMFTPSQKNLEWQRNSQQSVLNAAPDPEYVGTWTAADSMLKDAIGMVMGAAGGSALGGSMLNGGMVGGTSGAVGGAAGWGFGKLFGGG